MTLLLSEKERKTNSKIVKLSECIYLGWTEYNDEPKWFKEANSKVYFYD